jgi:FlaA1/EpsC-like NDP-sugar epimerase
METGERRRLQGQMNPPTASRAGQLLRSLPSLLIDFLIVMGSYAAALALRFDANVPRESWHWLSFAVPLIALGYVFANIVFGVYRTAWQYGGIVDVFNMGLAVTLVTLLAFGVNAMLEHRPIPLSVNLISGVFVFLFMGLVKLGPRLTAGSALPFFGWGAPAKRVLIVGGGRTGQLLARELLHNRQWDYRPVCFVDDDPQKRGVRIHGVPVLGNRFEIPDLTQKHRIDLVALAIPSASAETLHDVLAVCEAANVPVRMMPGVPEIVSGKARAGELREVTVDDLLSRDPVDIDRERCLQTLHGKSVVVTGAAGSIGAELCRLIVSFGPSALHLVDSNETGLHELRVDLLRLEPDCQVKPWLASIADRDKTEQVFAAARPAVVFHCAAYKHVPLTQENPDQAFFVNVMGTLNVFRAAQRWRSDKVVFLSSHTAVSPSSVLGATKRIGELLVKAMAGTGRTSLCAVRLVNVIDTRGSVLTTFWRQIQGGGPVSVTHPDVARYFLTVHEVAALIVQAAAQSNSGDVLVLDVGEATRIVELAEKMIRARGMVPGRDVEIVYTGLRPGEKLREELVGPDEQLVGTGHPKIFLAQGHELRRGAELLEGIAELESKLPESIDEIASRLHSLARLDLPSRSQASVTPDNVN